MHTFSINLLYKWSKKSQTKSNMYFPRFFSGFSITNISVLDKYPLHVPRFTNKSPGMSTTGGRTRIRCVPRGLLAPLDSRRDSPLAVPGSYDLVYSARSTREPEDV